MVYEVSNGHVTDDVTFTMKGQTRDSNMLRAQYLAEVAIGHTKARYH